MDYWRGIMNWPIDPNWQCKLCDMVPPESSIGVLMGKPFLTWGLCHGVCRCDVCHVEYAMRDYKAEGNPIVTTPICLLKAEYKAPFIKLWAEHHRPVDQITDEEWESAGIIFEDAKKVEKNATQ